MVTLSAMNPPEPDDDADPEPDVDQDDIDADGAEDSDYDPTEHMSAEELAELAREAQLNQEEYEAGLVRDAIRSISTGAAKAYLTSNGDAIDARINALLAEAKQLAEGHPGPSLVLAATALEITIRFLLLRPLVQGAFLSDRWAAILAARVATGRTAEDRKMLPAVLREWGVDLMKVKSSGGVPVWPFIVGRLWDLRDRFVHQADPVASDMAVQAIACAETFRKDVVGPVAKRLGFTLDVTKRWAATQKGKVVEESAVLNPFSEPAKEKKKPK